MSDFATKYQTYLLETRSAVIRDRMMTFVQGIESVMDAEGKGKLNGKFSYLEPMSTEDAKIMCALPTSKWYQVMGYNTDERALGRPNVMFAVYPAKSGLRGCLTVTPPDATETLPRPACAHDDDYGK